MPISENFKKEGTYRLFPYGKDQVLVRFANTADLFDHQTNSVVEHINLNAFAETLFKDVNNGNLPSTTVIEELNLSGNMLLSQLQRWHTSWSSQDDKNTFLNNIAPADMNGLDGVALEPQRLRTFIISYNGAERTNAFYKGNVVQHFMKQGLKRLTLKTP